MSVYKKYFCHLMSMKIEYINLSKQQKEITFQTLIK